MQGASGSQSPVGWGSSSGAFAVLFKSVRVQPEARLDLGSGSPTGQVQKLYCAADGQIYHAQLEGKMGAISDIPSSYLSMVPLVLPDVMDSPFQSSGWKAGTFVATLHLILPAAML